MRRRARDDLHCGYTNNGAEPQSRVAGSLCSAARTRGAARAASQQQIAPDGTDLENLSSEPVLTVTPEAATQPGRDLSERSHRAVALAVAIVAVGLLASAGAFLYSRSVQPSTPYGDELSPVIAAHNDAIDQWNSFLAAYNAIDSARPSEIDARAKDGFDLTIRLAVDVQSVIQSWDKVTPPLEMERAHALARDAIRQTQDGFVELADYFQSIIDYGIAFDDLVAAGRRRLERAALLWDEARAAADQAAN